MWIQQRYGTPPSTWTLKRTLGSFSGGGSSSPPVLAVPTSLPPGEAGALQNLESGHRPRRALAEGAPAGRHQARHHENALHREVPPQNRHVYWIFTGSWFDSNAHR